jgi:hypothetical protein
MFDIKNSIELVHFLTVLQKLRSITCIIRYFYTDRNGLE